MNGKSSLAFGDNARAEKDPNSADTGDMDAVALGSASHTKGVGVTAIGAYSVVKPLNADGSVELHNLSDNTKPTNADDRKGSVYKSVTKNTEGKVTVINNPNDPGSRDKDTMIQKHGETYGAIALGYAASSHAIGAK